MEVLLRSLWCLSLSRRMFGLGFTRLRIVRIPSEASSNDTRYRDPSTAIAQDDNLNSNQLRHRIFQLADVGNCGFEYVERFVHLLVSDHKRNEHTDHI